MGLSGPLRELTDFVEELQRGAGSVTRVEFPDRLTRETALATEIEVRLPFGSVEGDRDPLSVRAADVDSGGSLRLELETGESVVPATATDVESEIRETTIYPEGSITVVLAVSIASDDGSTASVGSARSDSDSFPDNADEAHTDPDATRTDPSASHRDVPPFRDRELLAEVYDSCETFAEMADTLEMDVTAETVRRYMIDHGIHEATTYDTTGDETDASDHGTSGDESDPLEPDADDAIEHAPAGDPDPSSDQPTPAETGGREQPVVLADGIGLSEDIDVDTLIDAVSKSRTIYEVKREIGIEREDAVETLRECNLLDLVVGRLSEDGANEVTRDEVVERLRARTATQ